MKNLIKSLTFFVLMWLILAVPNRVLASEESGSAAVLAVHQIQSDVRAERLASFLNSHKSVLAEDAGHFVSEADRLNLDWKLVAAIAGVESTFGKFVPAYSYNAWGWGIFTGKSDGVHFADWKDGITKVSEGLRYNYLDKGATTIEAIGHVYAASPAWSWKVNFFLEKIENYTPSKPQLLEVEI